MTTRRPSVASVEALFRGQSTEKPGGALDLGMRNTKLAGSGLTSPVNTSSCVLPPASNELASQHPTSQLLFLRPWRLRTPCSVRGAPPVGGALTRGRSGLPHGKPLIADGPVQDVVVAAVLLRGGRR